jgi:uncharacterized protein YndB with AHSA1/START domain
MKGSLAMTGSDSETRSQGHEQAALTSIHIEQRHSIEASRQVVWEILTRRISDWWQHPFRIYEGPAQIRLDLRPLGALAEYWQDNGFALWGHVSHVDPGSTLELNGPCGMGGAVHGIFTFHLEDRDGGVLLTLVHDAMGTLRSDVQESYEHGWNTMMTTLKGLAEGELRYGADARTI